MADAVTSQTIQDGGRNLIMKFTNVSDGSGESAVKKVDVSALSSDPMTGKECTRVAISKIQFSTVGMSVKVEFDASTNVLAAPLPADYTAELAFTSFTGATRKAGGGGAGGEGVT